MSFTISKAFTTFRSFSTTTSWQKNYGFIGLGQMGRHMAKHIYTNLGAEDHLYVHDVSPTVTDEFLTTVKQLPSQCGVTKLNEVAQFGAQPMDFIVTMVPEGSHVSLVVQQLAQSAPKDPKITTTIIDSSTIDIPTSIEINGFVKNSMPSFTFMDAPVSGGVAGARKALLSFMVSRATVEEVPADLAALLRTMGTNIFACGPHHGAGLAAKLSNNYLLAVTNLAVADSFQLAKSFGLDLHNYAKLVAVSTGKSWASVDNCPIPGAYPDNNLPADDDYNGGFVTKLTRKDLVLARESAAKNHRFLYLGDVSKFWYDKACEGELADKDLAVLYKWLGEIEENQGKELLKSM